MNADQTSSNPPRRDVSVIADRFAARLGAAPHCIARAPGRVNIIGEHTDYNGGYVLPMAIERATFIAARRRGDRRIRAYAANLEREAEVSLAQLERLAQEPWLDYVAGVAAELEKAGYDPPGADLWIEGNIPIGAGLSSSASLEMAALAVFEALGEFNLEDATAAQLGQRVENVYLGINSGIMDQFAVRRGQPGHALFLDCRTLEHELIPVKFVDAVFVIANTGVSRSLEHSKYNQRVAECQRALDALNRRHGLSLEYLSEYDAADLDACRETLDPIAWRRARHVIRENRRTRDAVDAMRRGDAEALGALMNESDASLREDYEVTGPELDAITSIGRSIDGCFGARMTGAGFGGCSINLVAETGADRFARDLLDRYERQTGLQGDALVTRPGAGAGILFKSLES